MPFRDNTAITLSALLVSESFHLPLLDASSTRPVAAAAPHSDATRRQRHRSGGTIPCVSASVVHRRPRRGRGEEEEATDRSVGRPPIGVVVGNRRRRHSESECRRSESIVREGEGGRQRLQLRWVGEREKRVKGERKRESVQCDDSSESHSLRKKPSS